MSERKKVVMTEENKLKMQKARKEKQEKIKRGEIAAPPTKKELLITIKEKNHEINTLKSLLKPVAVVEKLPVVEDKKLFEKPVEKKIVQVDDKKLQPVEEQKIRSKHRKVE